MRVILTLISVLVVSTAVPISNGDSRIIGGTLATIDRYPYVVAMLMQGTIGQYTHECGATIINRSTILTAAHCFFRNQNLVVWRLRSGSSLAYSGGFIHTLDHIKFHSEYVPPMAHADIALARVGEEFRWSPFVQDVSIPSPNYHLADNFEVSVAGWGATEEGFMSEHLREVQMYTINQQICSQRYGNSVINWSMLCAGLLGVGGRDHCIGDSGSPLVRNGTILGVASFSSCGSPFYPGVYARVTFAVDWIINNIY